MAKICRDVILNWVSHSSFSFSEWRAPDFGEDLDPSERVPSCCIKDFFSREFESVFKRRILVPPKDMYNNIFDACVCSLTRHTLRIA